MAKNKSKELVSGNTEIFNETRNDKGFSSLESSLKGLSSQTHFWFFNTSQFSDLVVQTTEQDFKVHKLVICGQSEYFSLMYSKEWKETAENKIVLKEDDPHAVEAMIHFMYGFDYDSSGNNARRVSPMLFNAKVYQIADKYSIPALKDISKEKFEHAVQKCWEMDDFPHAIVEVYANSPSTDKGLRSIVTEISKMQIQKLIQKEDFQNVLEEVASFGADLTRLLAEAPSKAQPDYKRYICPSCQNTWIASSFPTRTTRYCQNCGYQYSNWQSYEKPI
ncbi:hypothetical protein ASPWEDRAFT_166141 [Aspergillus wentii DTO 134E9]|uniref:BTB domain-containing protein n=1 Tax=Aspergillus wentii DTO 134E9 TaxID=1073089 RepID=A0A1L9RYV7_ASPWE|nr:uncharacterized protein ASPWEDRAFT_166141 [Aspergillus wentii DTO 134E9]KAI9932487.1 hypothetical protein MW887_008728 [Aspergillus wentii]OJJ40054.1 hypothetical protein ASPWEDRAFT_166141 [Aspergillus wentii DTO 134E9]